MVPLRFLFSFFLLSGIAAVQAQTHVGPCGNGGGEWNDALADRLLRNKQLLEDNPLQFRSTVYVPVRIHMVANSSGQGRVLHSRVLEQMCRLNSDFADMGMQFYIKGINDNINDTAIYNAQYNAGFIMNQLRDNSAFNIWIVDVAAPAAPQPGDEGQILGYYNPFRDWVVMRRDQAGSTTITLPHEVGHFFSLMHTHNGWDAQRWTAEIGNPAPAISPGGVPTERQDGTNCHNAGDFICDTPPDYNGFGFSGCNYNIAQDPTGTFIDPDEQLFMSYFLNCTRNDYYFSQTQQDLIWADYNHSSRNSIRSNFVPNLTEITEPATPIYPIGGIVTPGYNIVNLQWEAVTGADSYLLEIDLVPTFALSPIRVVVQGANTYTATTLQANKNYSWRVRPFNAYRTCAPNSAIATFRTGTELVSTQDITDLDSWTISPNPVLAQGAMQVTLQAGRGFEADFTLYNTAGQIVQRIGRQRINAGETHFEFSAENLSPGIYMLALDHQEGREVRRVVVVR